MAAAAALSVATAQAGPASAPSAATAYEQGHTHLNKAWELESRAVRAGYSSKARLEATEQALSSYRDALASFEAAAAQDPKSFQSRSMQGLVLRKLGRYSDALDAYAKALEINANDMNTIEYQAEAYLELGKFEQAKANYQILMQNNVQLAGDVLAAMTLWLDRSDPGVQAQLRTKEARDLRKWVGERTALTEQVAALDPNVAQRWAE